MGFGQSFHVDNWHHGVNSLTRRNGIKTRRWGMRVTVYTGADSGEYVLTYGENSTDIQDNANWLKVADIGQPWGGGGGSYTAGNGIYLDGSEFKLGGPLTENTVIDGDQFDFSIDLLNSFAITALETSSGDDLYGGIYGSPGLVDISTGDNFNFQSDISLNNLGVFLTASDYANTGHISITPNDINIIADLLTLELAGNFGDPGDVLTSDGTNASWQPGGGGGSYTADNGLTLNGSIFELGGTLNDNTSIDAADYVFDIQNASQIYLAANDPGFDNFGQITLTQGAAEISGNTVYIIVNGSVGDPGDVFTSDGTSASWQPGGGGGGITNSAANTELGMSDGTDIVPSGIFMPTVGQSLEFGSSSIAGTTRTFAAIGSKTNISFMYVAKGTGAHTFTGNVNLGETTDSGTSRTIQAQGSGSNIAINYIAKGTSRHTFTGDLYYGATSDAGTTRTIQAQGSGANIGMTFLSKGVGDFLFASSAGTAGGADIFTHGSFVANDAYPTPTTQTTYRNNGINVNSITAAQAWTLSGPGGIASAPNAPQLNIQSGIGFAAGDGDGGNILIMAAGGTGATGEGGDIEILANGAGTAGVSGNIFIHTSGANGGSITLETVSTSLGHITINPAGYLILANIPTSSAGVPSGAVWSNSGILTLA